MWVSTIWFRVLHGSGALVNFDSYDYSLRNYKNDEAIRDDEWS